VVSAVVPDDFHGAVEAVEHLYALGHRRLAFVGGPLSTSNGARRRASFDETVQRLGLPEVETVLISGELVVRGSTAPPPAGE
jgi:LacI family transcriptional regulator